MGTASEAVLLRRELVAAHRRHGEAIEALEGDIRRLVADLAQVTAERDGLRIAVRMRDATIEEAARAAAAQDEKIGRMSDEIDGIRSLLRRHENPNSPTSSWAACHKERDKLRALIGSYNDGDDGERGGGGPPARPRPAHEGGEEEEMGKEAASGRPEGRNGKAGKGKKEEGKAKGKGAEGEGREEEAAAPRRRRRGPGKSNNSKTEGSFLVGLGPSKCCGASHVVVGLVPKRHYDLIGNWLLAFDAANDGGRLLQDLARAAAKAGAAGRACIANLLFEAGFCAACGQFERATTPVSIPGSALGPIARERVLDLTNYMSNQEAADYIACYYGLAMSENMVANAVSASMAAMSHLHPRIAERIVRSGYAVIDEGMARAMGGWWYIVVACSGDEVLIAPAAGRSRAALEEALGPVWHIDKVTDEHSAYGDDGGRQSDFVHHLRSAEEPVVVWSTLFGDRAGEAGIDPRAELRAVEEAVVPPLAAMIRSSPGVRLVEGAELPSAAPPSPAAPPLPPPPRRPSLPRRARRTLRSRRGPREKAPGRRRRAAGRRPRRWPPTAGTRPGTFRC